MKCPLRGPLESLVVLWRMEIVQSIISDMIHRVKRRVYFGDLRRAFLPLHEFRIRTVY